MKPQSQSPQSRAPFKPLLPSSAKEHHQMQIAWWVKQHRGALSKIANSVKPRVSPQFVSQVLSGEKRSKDGRVERLLRDMGAPLR